MTSRHRILSVSSGRADVSLLHPVWRALVARSEIELHVLLTGMHRASTGVSISLPAGAVGHSGGEDLGGGSGTAAARGMMVCAAATLELVERIDFDCVMLVGDRLDMLPAAFAALPHNIPLAHIHGGELTYGVIDDRVRHAITKMAHLHFVSCVEAARRVAQMGEEPWRIHVTGGPGLDAMYRAPTMTAAAFAKQSALPFANEFLLVTVHPETNSDDPAAPLRATLDALDRCGVPALITAPNSDPGGQQLRAMIETFLPGRPQIAFRDSLGPELYPAALHHSVAMVGNSSSGLIEAGVFGLPVVDVGARQQGRVAGPNVQHVASDSEAILAVLGSLLAQRPRYPAYSPYGDGQASERIASVLAKLPDKRRLLYKRFNDAVETPAFAAPWAEAESIGRTGESRPTRQLA